MRLTTLNNCRCVHHHHQSCHSRHRRSHEPSRRHLHAPSTDPHHQGHSRGAESKNLHMIQNYSLPNKLTLINRFKLNMAKNRLKLKDLRRNIPIIKTQNITIGPQINIQSNINKMQCFRNSIPIVSNMPVINIQNSSILLINDSPFGLRDKRFGILHHSQPSESYYS